MWIKVNYLPVKLQSINDCHTGSWNFNETMNVVCNLPLLQVSLSEEGSHSSLINIFWSVWCIWTMIGGTCTCRQKSLFQKSEDLRYKQQGWTHQKLHHEKVGLSLKMMVQKRIFQKLLPGDSVLNIKLFVMCIYYPRKHFLEKIILDLHPIQAD